MISKTTFSSLYMRSLIVMGWLAIVSALALQFYANRKYLTPVHQGGLQISSHFSPLGNMSLWISPQTASLGATCLYPDTWSIFNEALSLPVERIESLCFGKVKEFRGSIVCSAERFALPFSASAVLKTSNGRGIVSAFYTYTDPVDESPHFESDFEFPSPNHDHLKVWTNQYSPDSVDALNSDPHLKNLGINASATFNRYTIEVYRNKTVFKVNGTVLEERQFMTGATPERVCFNSWFAKSWPRFYKDGIYETGFNPLQIQSVDINTLVTSQGGL